MPAQIITRPHLSDLVAITDTNPKVISYCYSLRQAQSYQTATFGQSADQVPTHVVQGLTMAQVQAIAEANDLTLIPDGEGQASTGWLTWELSEASYILKASEAYQALESQPWPLYVP
jgi:hypothetical protein